MGALVPEHPVQALRSDALTQESLTNNACPAGVTFQLAKVESVQHQDGSSHVKCSDGTQIQGRMVLDATGHARKLVEYDKPFDPGYQVPDFSPCHLSPCRHGFSSSVGSIEVWEEGQVLQVLLGQLWPP